MTSLLEYLSLNEVNPPTDKKFTVEKWTEYWGKTDKTEEDKHLYEAGLVFNDLLSNIRDELKILHKNYHPGISNPELARYYISISNRNHMVMVKNIPFEQKQNIYGLIDLITPFGNKFTIDEIDTISIDGIMPAIKFNLSNSDTKNTKKKSTSLINDFLLKEMFLSQQYISLESYWQAIRWSGYSFDIKNNNCIRITQPCNLEQQTIESSYIRYNKIKVQTMLLNNDRFNKLDLNQLTFFCSEYLGADCFLSLSKKNDPIKIKTIQLKKLNILNEEYKKKLVFWCSQYLSENDIYGPFLSEQIEKYGFSIQEVLNVYFQLICLAKEITDRYPKNDEIKPNKIRKLFQFSPEIKKDILVQKLNCCLSLDAIKINKILEFLTINLGRNKQDLWCHPLFLISKNYYILSTVSLHSPLFSRLLEHWIEQLIPKDRNKKGEYYEEKVIKNLSMRIERNSFLIDKELPRKITLSIKGTREEIDLIMRIGNIILVAELKCLNKPDSPISEYNNLATLKKGAKQAIRKSKFVKDNLTSVFRQLCWEYDEKIEYKIVKIVLNYSNMYSGMLIEDVPISDISILSAYFTDGKIPLVSAPNQKGKVEHFISAVIYEDFITLQANIEKYLAYPPQLRFTEPKFKYKDIKIPVISKNFKSLEYRRLIKEKYILDEMIKHYEDFPLIIKENIKDIKFNDRDSDCILI